MNMSIAVKGQWQEQIAHMRQASPGMLFNKIYTVLLMPFALAAVGLIRLLRPLVVIRLEPLDFSRIGGAYPGLYYLAEHSDGRGSKKFEDIFYFPPNIRVCNEQWVKMLKRRLNICPLRKFAHIVYKLNMLFPGALAHNIKSTHPPDADTLARMLAHDEPALKFTPQEEALGQTMLQDLGVSRGASFVCFHTRDGAYLKAQFPGKNWTHHDYRDASIQSYLPAVESLAEKGYFVIRMGAVVEENLHSHHPRIIDYAVNGKRTDFLDIYLGATCRFFLGSDSGITIVPETFHRPAVYTNWVSIQVLPAHYVQQGLIILKKWYSVKEQRFLSFREIYPFAKPHCIRPEEMGIELRENTADEIRDVVFEMEERLNGTWKTTEEDEELQRRFWEMYGDAQLRAPGVRIGAVFLRQNQSLLR